MYTSCGELIASVQKDGWSYAIDAHLSPGLTLSRARLNGPSWQFPPTTNGGWFTDCNQVHGDDDYRRPGACLERRVHRQDRGREPGRRRCVGGKLATTAACAQCLRHRRTRPSPLDHGDISNNTSPDGHISFSSPTVTGGIVFIGTNQNKRRTRAISSSSPIRASRPPASRFALTPMFPCGLQWALRPRVEPAAAPGHPDAGRRQPRFDAQRARSGGRTSLCRHQPFVRPSRTPATSTSWRRGAHAISSEHIN